MKMELMAEEKRNPSPFYDDRRMLETYSPFGKSQNRDLRRKKWLETDLTPRGGYKIADPFRESEVQAEARTFVEQLKGKTAENDEFFIRNRGVGGGAPLRRENGEVNASLRGDPAIRFNDNDNLRSHVNNHLRYATPREKQEEYGEHLRWLMKEQEVKEQEEKIEKLKQELNHLGTDPYGAPGAGAPYKTSSGSFLQREEEKDFQLRSDPGPYRMERVSLKKRPNYEKVEPWSPWGKPGGGAPNKDKEGHIQTTIYGGASQETTMAEQKQRARGAKAYSEALRRGMEEQQANRAYMNNLHREPLGETLVDKIGAGKVGKPRRDPFTGELADQKLGASDVSKTVIGKVEVDKDFQRNYHDQLSLQAEERHNKRHLGYLKDHREDRLHYDTAETFWGRPGAGAPLGQTNRKANFERIINEYPDRRRRETYARQQADEQRTSQNYDSPSKPNNQNIPPNNESQTKRTHFTPWATYSGP